MVNIFCYSDAHKTVTAIHYTSTWNTPTPDLSYPYCTQRCLPYLAWHITVYAVKLPVAQLANILCSTKFFVRFTTVSQWLLQYVTRIHSTSHPNFPSIHLNNIFSSKSRFHKSVPFSVFKLNFAHIFNFYHSWRFVPYKESGNVLTDFENSPTEWKGEISMYTKPSVCVYGSSNQSKMATCCLKMVTVCSYEARACDPIPSRLASHPRRA